MSTFQLLLFLISAVVFYLFFKQLFSSSYPKRGVDFEAKKDDEQIGTITERNKTFSEPEVQVSRINQLISMANSAIEKDDYVEADKALTSANIIEPENEEVLLQHGFVLLMLERFEEAKEVYESLLELNEKEDMAHVALANLLHKLGEDDLAKEHHLRAIELDKKYAPHHFNFANTLYDLKEKEEALKYYKSALALDSTLEEAQKMLKELS
ncbi:MAG: O-linked GlcNAc transferase [uncultured Sulfurovum sp.]|uniref:O-linked GlcNAc transferase n=1 Tax=uncultured Sulfurovum sp. TaxID=269237 RepID=A0A6S6SXF6_9BACT|nr:MAG: O-linked GlcNAc transferase [uncultured Sulfurovum sp.]